MSNSRKNYKPHKRKFHFLKFSNLRFLKSETVFYEVYNFWIESIKFCSVETLYHCECNI